jgi:cold shock CspA family protein
MMAASSQVDATAASRVLGTVKWFNDAKGFGFISHAGLSYFVSAGAILNANFLTGGEAVTFREYLRPDGTWEAVAVKVSYLATLTVLSTNPNIHTLL